MTDQSKPPQPKRKAGRPKGAVSKSSALAKEAIARFVDGNAHRFERWLDLIEQRDGPLTAFRCVESLLEYHVPKLSRREVTGADDGPVELTIRWSKEGE